MTYYQELLNKFGYIDTPQIGKNEDNEDVLVSIDKEAACIRTIQKSGWHRINIYYSDGMEEELYEK